MHGRLNTVSFTCPLFCRYVRSLNSDQTGGENVAPSDLGACAPQQFADVLQDGTPAPPNTAINPCGLMAYSYFNDTFDLTDGSRSMGLDVSCPCALHTAYAWDVVACKQQTPSNRGQWIAQCKAHVCCQVPYLTTSMICTVQVHAALYTFDFA